MDEPLLVRSPLVDPSSDAAAQGADGSVDVVLIDLARLSLPDQEELLGDLADNGVAVLLTADIPASEQDLLAGQFLDTGLVSAIVNASLVGTAMPDAEFFELCMEFCDVAPDQMVLVDDRVDNLDAAASLGIRGVLIDDDADLTVDTVRRLTLGSR